MYNIFKKKYLNNFFSIIFKYFFSFFFVGFILLGCTNSYECVEGDDFGFSIYNIPSTSSNIHTIGSQQYIDWYDTGLNINGHVLSFYVQPSRNSEGKINHSNVWAPWLCTGQSSVHNCKNSGNVSPFMFDVLCTFSNQNKYIPPQIASDICYISEKDKAKQNMEEAIDFLENVAFSKKMYNQCNESNASSVNSLVVNNIGAPCMMGDGMGLYALILPKDEYRNPNSQSDVGLNIASAMQKSPNGTKWATMHMNDNGIVMQDGFQDYIGGKLYFKIIDSYYSDNAGNYTVVIKSGASSNQMGPISYVFSIVHEIFDSVSYEMYQGIVNSNTYQRILYVSLLLYITFYALSFVIGIAEFSQKELMIRILKFSLVLFFLSSNGGAYFYTEYLSKFFIQGLMGVVNIVTDSNGSNYGEFLDSAWNLLFSRQLFIKVMGAGGGGIVGFLSGMVISTIYLFLIYIAVIVICISSLIVAVFYISCLIIIDFLIAFAPIYFIFILFSRTKSLFESWLKLIISNFLQAIIIISGFTYLFQFFYSYLYKVLGYKVCSEPVGIEGFNLFYRWVKSTGSTIGPVQLPFSSNVANCIPSAIQKCSNEDYNVVDAFTTIPFRYVDMPALDIVLDSSMISAIMGDGLKDRLLYGLLLVLISWIVYTCVNVFPMISSMIAGTQYNYSNPQYLADGIVHTMKSLVSEAMPKKFKRKMEEVKMMAGSVYEGTVNKVKELPGNLAGKAHKKFVAPRVKAINDAMTPKFARSAKSAILGARNKIADQYGKFAQSVDQSKADLSKRLMPKAKSEKTMMFGHDHRADLEKMILRKREDKKNQHEREGLTNAQIQDELKKYDDFVKEKFNIDVQDLLK